jgi:hypothetical protein
MSESSPDPTIAELSAKVTSLVWTIKWLVTLLILVASVPNFIAAISIPRFQQIFADALPGKPLPTLTNFLIAAQGILLFASVGWPIAAIINSCLNRHLKIWAAISIVILGLIALQLIATILGCMMPMQSGPTGMSDQAGGH